MDERPQKRPNPDSSLYEAPAKRQATGAHYGAGSQVRPFSCCQGTASAFEDFARKTHSPDKEQANDEPRPRMPKLRHKLSEPTDEQDSDQDQSSYGDGEDDAEDEPQSTSEHHTPSRSAKRKAGRGAGSPGSLTSGCRHDCSLGMLTKKFLTLIDDAADGILDLNKAAETLKVQKRRIYDITNVLEGVGLIEKKSKNNIRWRGASAAADRETEPESNRLRQDMKSLEDQERSLDDHIRYMTTAIQSLSDNPLNKPRLYVTDEDVTSLPCFANDTIFAVKAPPGTTLEVPDPREAADPRDGGQMRYRIILRSTKGPIDVYLVQHTNNGGTTSQQAAAPTASAEPAGSTVGTAGIGSTAAAAVTAGGGTTCGGSAAGASGMAAAGGVPSAPPTVVKPEPSGASGQHGGNSPAYPFQALHHAGSALPTTTGPVAAGAAAAANHSTFNNGASSFFNSAYNSPTAAQAGGDPLSMPPLPGTATAAGAAAGGAGPLGAGVGHSPGLPGRLSSEVDAVAWYDESAQEPPLLGFYSYDQDENFFATGLGGDPLGGAGGAYGS
ncbi:hypothetical protein Agub_g15725 [Astrephomene gubernaculifera]|uniref:E2F/DP family winged-helix DNA-binding domain-containing protein n=1 Tax=Astrephomene gubernaculifera TaxID=47775 RepID=A0AAD3E5L9_9CHLO|nr:hypothetical protein Agub_g15725 [Astrephomene gubernaculifera]